MERRLLVSTVAVALALGTAAASAQTRRPAEHDRTAPQATPSPDAPRAETPTGAAAPNAPMPQAQQTAPPQQPMPNASAPAPSATTGQAPAQAPPRSSATGNAVQPPAGGQTQSQPQSTPAQDQPQRQGQAAPATTQSGASTGAGEANVPPNENANANANANAAAGNPQGVITLNEQQNTRVAQAIRQANVRPLSNVSFSIAIGTTVPVDLQLNVLPPALAEVVPQYRGFSFVVVEQEALIIDPGSRAIVAVVPFEATQMTGVAPAAPPPAPAQAAAPPPPREHKTDLTREHREPPRRQAEHHQKSEKSVTIEKRRSTTGAGPREPDIGDRVPDRAVVEGRPPLEVYPDEPPVRSERHHPSVRDIPLIGPLIGPPDPD